MSDKTAETDRITVAAELNEERAFKIDGQNVPTTFEATYTVIARVDPAQDFGKYDFASFSKGGRS